MNYSYVFAEKSRSQASVRCEVVQQSQESPKENGLHCPPELPKNSCPLPFDKDFKTHKLGDRRWASERYLINSRGDSLNESTESSGHGGDSEDQGEIEVVSGGYPDRLGSKTEGTRHCPPPPHRPPPDGQEYPELFVNRDTHPDDKTYINHRTPGKTSTSGITNGTTIIHTMAAYTNEDDVFKDQPDASSMTNGDTYKGKRLGELPKYYSMSDMNLNQTLPMDFSPRSRNDSFSSDISIDSDGGRRRAPPLQRTRQQSLVDLMRTRRLSSSGSLPGSRLQGIKVPSVKSGGSSVTPVTGIPTLNSSARLTSQVMLLKPMTRRHSYQPQMQSYTELGPSSPGFNSTSPLLDLTGKRSGAFAAKPLVRANTTDTIIESDNKKKQDMTKGHERRQNGPSSFTFDVPLTQNKADIKDSVDTVANGFAEPTSVPDSTCPNSTLSPIGEKQEHHRLSKSNPQETAIEKLISFEPQNAERPVSPVNSSSDVSIDKHEHSSHTTYTVKSQIKTDENRNTKDHFPTTSVSKRERPPILPKPKVVPAHKNTTEDKVFQSSDITSSSSNPYGVSQYPKDLSTADVVTVSVDTTPVMTSFPISTPDSSTSLVFSAEKTTDEVVEDDDEPPSMPETPPPSLPSAAPPSMPSTVQSPVDREPSTCGDISQDRLSLDGSSSASQDTVILATAGDSLDTGTSGLGDTSVDGKSNDSLFDSSDELDNTQHSSSCSSGSRDVMVSISREDLSEGRGSMFSTPDVGQPLSPTPSDADSGIYSTKVDHQRSDSGQYANIYMIKRIHGVMYS